MKCLNCNNITEVSDYRKITNYFCPNCKGCWVPGDTIRKLTNPKRLEIDHLKIIHAFIDNSRNLNCPTCKIKINLDFPSKFLQKIEVLVV
jgi:hypothetical protein